jgi:hypothetical protein
VLNRVSNRSANPSDVTQIIIRLATHIKNPVPMMLMMIPIVKRMANTLFGWHVTMSEVRGFSKVDKQVGVTVRSQGRRTTR